MKKLFVFAAICALSISTVKADGFDRDRIITKEQLPATSQNFISEHFAGSKIAYVKEDRDFISKNYEVKFSDGSKVEFSRDGAWKEVSCLCSAAATAVIWIRSLLILTQAALQKKYSPLCLYGVITIQNCRLQ